MSWNRTPALSLQEHERTVIRDFWTALKQFAGRLPFVEDLVAASYCALDPATPMRVRGVLLARPENKQWLLQLTLLALACSAG